MTTLKPCVVCGAPRTRKLFLHARACCSWKCMRIAKQPGETRWRQRNPERVRAYKAKWMAKYRQQKRQQGVDAHG